MSNLDDFGLIKPKPGECPRCLELCLKIKRGEITGVVMSCHPLDMIIDGDLAKYIESREIGRN